MKHAFAIWILALAIWLPSAGYADTVNYTYDDAGRLTNVDYGNGKSIAYSYDKAGNLLSRVVTPAAQIASQAARTAKTKSRPVADKYQETRSTKR